MKWKKWSFDRVSSSCVHQRHLWIQKSRAGIQQFLLEISISSIWVSNVHLSSMLFGQTICHLFYWFAEKKKIEEKFAASFPYTSDRSFSFSRLNVVKFQGFSKESHGMVREPIVSFHWHFFFFLWWMLLLLSFSSYFIVTYYYWHHSLKFHTN